MHASERLCDNSRIPSPFADGGNPLAVLAFSPVGRCSGTWCRCNSCGRRVGLAFVDRPISAEDSAVKVYVIPANEELGVARRTYAYNP